MKLSIVLAAAVSLTSADLMKQHPTTNLLKRTVSLSSSFSMSWSFGSFMGQSPMLPPMGMPIAGMMGISC
jgi:hypothetical protein